MMKNAILITIYANFLIYWATYPYESLIGLHMMNDN